MIETERVVFVDGPGPCKAKFLHDWLSAAKEVDLRLFELVNMDAEQAKRSVAERGCMLRAAVYFLGLFAGNLSCFTVSISDEHIAAFAMMAKLGFFQSEGDTYRMTIPGLIGLKEVKSALQLVAETEEDPYHFHPEMLLVTLDDAAAEGRKESLAQHFSDPRKGRYGQRLRVN